MSRGSESQYFEPNVLSFSDAASAEAAMAKLLEDANTSLKDGALTANQGTWPASQLESSGALPTITLTFDAVDKPEGYAGGDSQRDLEGFPIQIQENLSESALSAAAGDIRSALNFESILGHFGKVDSDRIINILDSMSLVDRQNLEAQYLLRYRTHLREDLEWRLWPEPYARSIAVLDRIDGVTNDVGQIDIALTLLGSDQKRGELTLIQSLMVLNSQQIADLNGEYLARHGRGLFDTILGETRLSESAKQVVRILLNGTDNNIDLATGKWTLPAFEQLSELALESADIQFFELVFSSASDQACEQFSASGGGDKIFTAFMRNFDDLKLAIELAGAGEIRLSTIIRGNTHFLHTDRDSIELALRHASPDDRELYLKGRELNESGANPAIGPDADALTFYRDIHDALSYSSGGTDWEIIKFEDILLRGGSLIEKVMNLEEPNLLGIGGTHHVTEAVMSQLENMSSEDWQRLRSDTRFEQDLRAALESTLDDHEESIAFSMLDAKKSAASFDESRLAGRRSVIEVINENSWGGVLYRYEPGIIINRILSMSASELANYRNGLPASRTDLLSVIDDKLGREPEHSLALRLLAQAEQVSAVVPTEQVAQANGGTAKLQLSPADQVIYDKITKAPPQVLFRHLEQAFSDPALRERFQNPQNEDDRMMRQSLYAAAEYALSDANISTRNKRQPYFDAFFSSGADGSLPINLEMALCKTDADRLAVLRNCNENERTLLLTEGTSNQEAVVLQRAVLNPLNDDLRELFLAVLNNDFVSDQFGTESLAFHPEDQVRAFVLSAGEDPIHGIFENLTNDQVVSIKNAYAEKFGSDLSGDVLKSVDEKKRFAYANLLETVSNAARQDYYDLQVEFSEHLNGLAPDLMRSFGWNASQEDALRQSDQFRNALMEYSSNFQDLPPDRQDSLARNFAEAIENFRKSKEEFSDVAVDAAIMAVGFLLAAVTAGQSINIALLLKAAALGATMKLAGGKVMQGSDYDSTEIAGDVFMGAVMMAGNLIGPAAVAKGLGIGRNAVRTAVSELDVFFKQAHIVERLAQSGLTFEPAAMQKGLEQIYRTILLTGKKVDEKAYYSIIERALAPAGDVALTANVPAGMADLARRNFVEGFAKGLADDFYQTSLAGRTPFQNFRLHLGLSELTAIPVGAVASGGSRLLAWDSRKSFNENIQDAFVSAGFGAAFGAGLSLAFTAGAHTLGYLVRNGKDYIFHNSGSESRSITTIEGTKKDLPPGQWLEIAPTDTIDLPPGIEVRALGAPDFPAHTAPDVPAISPPGNPAEIIFAPPVGDLRIASALAQSVELDRPIGADVAYNIKDTKAMQGMSGKSPSGRGNTNELLDDSLVTALESPEPSNVVVRPFGQYTDGSYNWTNLERYSTAELERMLEVLRPGYPAVSSDSLDQFVEVMYEALNGSGSSATLRKLMPKDLRGKMTVLDNERALERVQVALDTFCEENGLPYMLVNLAALDPNVRASYSNGYILLNDNVRLADNLPQTTNNIGHELSHGQQSYVQIARAIQILEENGITSEQEQNLALRAAPFGFHSESLIAEVREMVEAGELAPEAYALGAQLLKVRELEFDRGFGAYSPDDPEAGALRLILRRIINDMQLTTDEYLPEEIARRFLRTTGYILPDSLLFREYDGQPIQLTEREIELSELFIDSYESNQGSAGRAMAAKRLSIAIGETIKGIEKGDIQPDVLIATSDLFFPAIGSSRFDGKWATLWDSVQSSYSAAAADPSLLASRNNDETRAHLLRILNERRQQLELYHEGAITMYMGSAVEIVPYLLSEILERKTVQYAEQHKQPVLSDRWRSILNPGGQSMPQDLSTATQPDLLLGRTPALTDQVSQSKISEAMLSDSEVFDIVVPDWFSTGFVRRYEGKIRFEDQLRNVHIRVFDEPGSSSSQRFLRESISKSVSTELFNTVPATVRRTIPIDGVDTDVWIQDGTGRTFGPGLAISEVYDRPIWTEAEFLDVFRTNERLSQAWERAVVERSILGSLDAHSANFTFFDQGSNVPESQRFLVGNIDLPDTFGTREVPIWRLAEFKDINNTLFQEMTGKPLHPDTVHEVALFIARFDSPEGRQFLTYKGMSNEQIEALLSRAKWFTVNQRFPDIQ